MSRHRFFPLAVCMAATLVAVSSPARAQRIRRVTDFRPSKFGAPRIDDSGTRIAAWWQGDPLGQNPQRAYRVMLWDSVAQTLTQVGTFSDTQARPLDISDDGQWIALVSTSNPLGTNADGSEEVFYVSTDGATVRQLTSFSAPAGAITRLALSGGGLRIVFSGDVALGGPVDGIDQVYTVRTAGGTVTKITTATDGVIDDLSISDDGARIVFTGNGSFGLPHGSSFSVYRAAFDGSSLAIAGADARRAAISGDGATILYYQQGLHFMRTTDWLLTTVNTLLDCGFSPCSRTESITDDGAWVFFLRDAFSAAETIEKVPGAGGPPVTVATTSSMALGGDLRVAGGGTRLVLNVDGGTVAGVDNPDAVAVLIAVDEDGANPAGLTDNVYSGYATEPSIASDGGGAAFVLDDRLMTVDAAGTDLRHLAVNVWPESPSISGDEVAFVSYSDIDGLAGCSSMYNLAFGVSLTTSALTLLSPPPGTCNTIRGYTDAAGNGTVLFQTSTVGDMYVAPFTGGAAVQITDDSTGIRENPRISADGQWAVYQSDSDQVVPGNTGFQVFRVPTDGSMAIEAVTSDLDWGSLLPDVSDDGTRIAYQSRSDPLGTNADHNNEIFVRDVTTATTVQLTETTSGDNYEPLISGDGTWVYFSSSAGLLLDGSSVFRVRVADGRLERVTGTATGPLYPQGLRYRPLYSVGYSGDRAVLASRWPQVGDDIPGGLSQIYFVEFDLAAQFDISASSPTVLSWESDPRYRSYDVIRGDVANLGPGGPGQVDLGPVVCIEDDSTDTSTVGFEDAAQPTSGQVFFYLYRGQVAPGLPGDGWGQSSAGDVRIPASGACVD